MNNLPQKFDPTSIAGRDWPDILNELWESILESGEPLPDPVVRATELLINGLPIYKVAREIQVNPKTVKSWLEKYPVMKQAVTEGRQLITFWRLSQIEGQFVDAIEVSKRVLNADLERCGDGPVNSKLLGIQAQHARYILDLFFKNNIQNLIININKPADEDKVLKARKDALDYLADRLKSSEDIEDASFIEIHSPEFGHFGSLTVVDNKVQCHLCGQFFSDLINHIGEHGLEQAEYEMRYILQVGELNKWQTEK